MRKSIIAGLVALLPLTAAAQQPSVVGRWKTLDDETGRPMTVVETYRTTNGQLAAKIVENIAAPATCDKCSGRDRGRPIVGTMVLWGLKDKGNGTWGDGNGFKPSSGDSFKAKSLQLSDGGQKLQVTGCKLMFCRTATWVRE